MEERTLLVRSVACGDAFERVPEHREVAGLAVRREIAFEHAAVRADLLDAVLEKRSPHLSEPLGRRGLIELVEAQPQIRHAETAKLHVDIRTLRELGHRRAPV